MAKIIIISDMGGTVFLQQCITTAREYFGKLMILITENNHWYCTCSFDFIFAVVNAITTYKPILHVHVRVDCCYDNDAPLNRP